APLEGLVETDWATASFTMNWKLTRPFKGIKFQKDEPICMLVPQKRGELEAFAPEIRNLESDAELEQKYKHWLEARRAWATEQKKAGPPKDGHAPHQGHYSRGSTTTGDQAPEHQSKLALQPFAELEPPILEPVKDAPQPAVAQGFWPRLKR